MSTVTIMLGAPGVGKGTIGGRLSRQWKLPLISSGDLLRDHVKRQTPLGTEAADYMKRGELVPDDIVIGMIRERITAKDCAPGFILDGFPRTPAQAEVLEPLLSGMQVNVVLLKADEEFIVGRLSGRMVCTSCGQIYHLVNLPPKSAGICDRCGCALIRRDDDREDVIRKRLAVYQEQTAPLLDYYRRQKMLTEMPGDGIMEETIAKIDRLRK